MITANDKTTAQAQMLANRLQKRFRHLKKWAQRTGAGAFRLYDRDIPEIPLVLDFYGDCTLPLQAALCGALYKRPYEKDEADEERWLSEMKNSAAAALGINPGYVFLKQRQKQKGASQYEKMGQVHFEKIVNEGGFAFKVNLSDYLDTGLFPDRRLLRSLIRTESAGKKVLNLFSYTGSFSVYAAAGKAAITDSVDLSNTYLAWARENFSLNGFSAALLRDWDFFTGKGRTAVHQLIRADVLEFIEKAAAGKIYWDIIIIDPPAFSNSKKMTGNFDLNRDLTELLGKCMNLLAPGGKIFLSVNLRRSALSAAELETVLNVRVTDLETKITDEDFSGRKIPKAFLLIKE
jgi:23S rRNA G2069 N7-methylase RlmK/C1962 C5-methylase RlmI